MQIWKNKNQKIPKVFLIFNFSCDALKMSFHNFIHDDNEIIGNHILIFID